MSKYKSRIDKVYFSYSAEYKEVTACFPELEYNYQYITCYSQSEQHSGMDPYYPYNSSEKQATEKQYASLKKELESIGYELEVIDFKQYAEIIKGGK